MKIPVAQKIIRNQAQWKARTVKKKYTESKSESYQKSTRHSQSEDLTSGSSPEVRLGSYDGDLGSADGASDWTDEAPSSRDEVGMIQIFDGDNSEGLSYMIRDALKIFTSRCNVPRRNLRILMNLLRPIDKTLPNDPRTVIVGAY